MTNIPDLEPPTDLDPRLLELVQGRVTLDTYLASSGESRVELLGHLIGMGSGHGDRRMQEAALDLVFDDLPDLIEEEHDLRIRLCVNQVEVKVHLGARASRAVVSLTALLDETRRRGLHPETELQVMYAIAQIEASYAPVTRRAASLEALHRRALEAAPDSPYVVASAMDLAELHFELDDVQAAFDLVSSAEARVSGSTPRGLVSRWVRAAVHSAIGAASPGDGERLLRTAIGLASEYLGRSDVATLQARHALLGHEERSQGSQRVLAQWKKLLGDHERILGKDHPRTLIVTAAYGAAREDSRKTPQGNSWWSGLSARVVEARAKDRDDKDLELAYGKALSRLADGAMAAGTYGVALGALQELMGLADAVFEPNDEAVRSIRARIDHARRHSAETSSPSAVGAAESPDARVVSARRRRVSGGSRKARLQLENEARQFIRESGYLVRVLGSRCEDPGCSALHDDDGIEFGYSVGLSGRFEHPELVITGLPQMSCADPINALAEQVKLGVRFRPGVVESVFPLGHAAALIEVDPSKSVEFLTLANALYRRPGRDPVAALQIVWPDQDGRFPWDEGCVISPGTQPLWGDGGATSPRSVP